MPRILFLCHRVPFPPNRGDRIRSFHILKHLAERAEVSLAYTTDEPPPPETTRVLESLCHRVAYDQLGPARWLRSAASLASGRTATEGLFRSTKLRKTISRWASAAPFDAVFVFCSSMVQYVDAPGLAGVPTVVDLVDVDSQKWFDYAEHARGPRRFLLNLEATRLRHLESSLPNRVDAITVVANREADVFSSFCPCRPHVIRNGVDLDYFRPTDNASSSLATDNCPLTTLFVGALDYDANVDGVTWFCREVWPQVLSRFPQATFQLVGSRPNAQAKSLGKLPGVQLIGEVPDVRPHLHNATLVVVPLRVARGIQNKVLEALAATKPAIVSPQALDGINASPNIDLIRAATPHEWVDAISRLFSDAGVRSDLACSGRAFVEHNYRWEEQLQQLTRLPGLHRCQWGSCSS